VTLILYGASAKNRFRELMKSKSEIEAEIGETLEVCEMPNSIQSQIRLTRTGVDVTDRASWPEQHEWLCEKLELFHKVFAPRVKTLDATDQDSNPRPADVAD
jgi:hypothetical protein